jgi:hydroxymethylpyrimidine pyrophosphatase-like HAD family hydrolase
MPLTDNKMPIRLLVFDIDGVLTLREGKAFDLPLLKRLAEFNEAAREDPSRPAVTVCTGRPAAYVEAVLRAIDGHVPAVFENGAGLYLPDDYRFLPHPMLGDQAGFRAVQQLLEEGLVRTGQAILQPGKEYSLSLLARDPSQATKLRDLAITALGPLYETVDLVYSMSCLNVLPRGIHKGQGIQFLASQTDYALPEMLGVGDSDVDLPFLAKVGYSAAPANANLKVRQSVQYIAPRPAAHGVLDILDYFGLTS